METIKEVGKMLGLITLSLALVIGVLAILFFVTFFSGSGWKTQNILFRNKENSKIRIEFQMEDVGAFGYQRRIVKVEPGLLFDSIDRIDTISLNKADWKQVDELVNEMNLKFP